MARGKLFGKRGKKSKGDEGAPVQPSAPQLGGQEVKVVSKDGSVLDDGVLKSIDTTKAPTLVFDDGRKCKLGKGNLVVERVSVEQMQALPAGTPVLLVQAWGCGGTLMELGKFTQALEGSFICFQGEDDEEGARPVNLSDMGDGSYKVLWGM